jgi:hypothetical protein
VRARLLVLLTAAVLALGGLAAAPAQAEPPPDGDRLTVTKVLPFLNPSIRLFFGAGFLVARATDGATAPAGTQVTLSVSPCGNLVHQASLALDGSGPGRVLAEFDRRGETVNSHHVGRSLDWTVEVAQPGYDTYTESGSHALDGWSTGDGPVVRPTCDVVKGPCRVERWSVKEQRRARYRGSLSVTSTETLECEVTYTWLANGTAVRSGPARWVALGRRYLGKRVTLVVTATKNGDTQTRTYRYGRVRRTAR